MQRSAFWQTFQDVRSSLSVSQPFRSVGTPPLWSWAATWLTLRTGSSPWMLLRWGFVWGRAAFCLRSALAAFDVHALPWAALRDYFIRRYRTAVVRDRTEQEKTEPNRRKRNHTKMKYKTEKGKPCIIVASNFQFLFFSPQLLFAEVLGSELLLLRFFFPSFLGVVLGQERSFFPALFDFGFQNNAKECIV